MPRKPPRKPKPGKTPRQPKPPGAPRRAEAPRPPSGAGGGDALVEVGALLKNLPGLACEPELAGLELEREPLQRALRAGEPAPRTIEHLADLSFHARLLVGLNALRNRAALESDDTLRFLVDSAQYYIEEVRGPAWDNPLVVACYYRDVARLENRPFRAGDALAACGAYEQTHQALLEQMLADRQRQVE